LKSYQKKGRCKPYQNIDESVIDQLGSTLHMKTEGNDIDAAVFPLMIDVCGVQGQVQGYDAVNQDDGKIPPEKMPECPA
jgi:hypothetical protein